MRVLLLTFILALTSCGGYFNPFAVLIVTPKDATENSAVKIELGKFAQKNQLRQSRPYQSSSDPSKLRLQKEHTIHYISDKGFHFTVYAASPQCMAVTFVERERDWTAQSLAGLIELQEMLRKVAKDRVRLASSPNDWKSATRTMEQYCAQVESNKSENQE